MTSIPAKLWSATRRGTEAVFSLVLALLCFVAILAILGLSFPEGMSLRDVIGSGEVAGAGDAGPREVDIEGAVLADVAVLAAKNRRVKDKPANAIAWQNAQVGMGLGGGHAIQTFENSGATLSFGEGSELILGENSLVVLKSFAGRSDGTNREASVVILGGELRGSIAGKAADQVRVRVETASGTAELRTRKAAQGPTRFRVAVDEETKAARVTVEDGTAEVSSAGESVVLEANQAVEVEPDAPLGAPVTLLGVPEPLAPEPGATRTYRTLPPRVTFRWRAVSGATDYLFTLASDREFRTPVFQEPRRGTSFDFGSLVVGDYYWRVSARRDGVVGDPGPSRRLRVRQDQAPPSLRVDWPTGLVRAARVAVRGRTEPGSRVFVADEEVAVDAAGTFSHEIALKRGTNVVVVEAVDSAGNATYESRMIESDSSRTE